MFSPEFRNRLSAIIDFAPLSPLVVERVVEKFIGELSDRLKAQKVKLEVTEKARKWLAEHGYDPKFGARPLGRLIENEIARSLADELLFGRLKKGGTAVVDLGGRQAQLRVQGNARAGSRQCLSYAALRRQRKMHRRFEGGSQAALSFFPAASLVKGDRA